MEVKIISTTQTVVNYLRDQIIIGEISPGQKLNESLWASRLGISIPPLRESFRILEGERLVVSVPRKSTYVTEISEDDFKAVYQSRGMIECYAIDLIQAKKIQDFSLLDGVLNAASNIKIESGIELKELLKYARIFAEFHVKLIELSGNGYLIHFYRSIISNVFRYQFLYFVKGTSLLLLEEHSKILDFIRVGDYEQAKKNLLLHINYSFEKGINSKSLFPQSHSNKFNR